MKFTYLLNDEQPPQFIDASTPEEALSLLRDHGIQPMHGIVNPAPVAGVDTKELREAYAGEAYGWGWVEYVRIYGA